MGCGPSWTRLSNGSRRQNRSGSKTKFSRESRGYRTEKELLAAGGMFDIVPHYHAAFRDEPRK
jgi:hypothetical protein